MTENLQDSLTDEEIIRQKADTLARTILLNVRLTDGCDVHIIQAKQLIH